MSKSSCVLVLLLIINFANIFVIGKSAVGGSKNDKENAINVFSGSVNKLEKYYSHALVALAENIKSEFQNLKAQVARLEDRVERHDTFMNDSMEEIKRQLQLEGMEKKNGVQVQGQNLPSRSCPRGFSHNVAGFPKCYAVLRKAVDWNSAQEECKKLHSKAHLAVINSSGEQDIITGIVRDRACSQQNRLPDNKIQWINAFWIGARRGNITDCDSAFEWTSSNGSTFPIEYSNWVDGEPNCGGSNNEACASVNKYYVSKWNDLMCTWSACPLCEVTINA